MSSSTLIETPRPAATGRSTVRSTASPRCSAAAVRGRRPRRHLPRRGDRASSSASSAPRAAARPPCSTWWPASTRPRRATVRVARAAPALMFQEAALFPWLTVRRQRRAGPAAPGRRRKAERRRAGRRAARPRAPRRLRRPPAPRALRRHAPAGRPGPGPGPGGRRAAHGRALRRPRRHDPRPPPRRARAASGASTGCTVAVRHPQRAGGGPPGRPDRPADQPPRPGGRGVRRRRRPGPAASRTPTCPRWPARSPTACARRWPPWPLSRAEPPSAARPRLGQPSSPASTPSSSPPAPHRSFAAAAVGRDLAEAGRHRLALARLAAASCGAGWKPEYVLPGPARRC